VSTFAFAIYVVAHAGHAYAARRAAAGRRGRIDGDIDASGAAAGASAVRA